MMFTLPTDLVTSILSSWLQLKDRVRLDSACCNVSIRKPFLEILRCRECSVKSWVLNVDRDTTDNVIVWASARDIPVEKIAIGLSSNFDAYEAYFRRFGKSVSEVKFHSTRSRALKLLVFCQNILRFDLLESEVSSSLCEVLKLCTHLQDFRCSFHNHSKLYKSKIKGSDFKNILCPNLKIVKLEFCEDSALTAIIKLAVRVEVLVLLCCGSQSTLEAHAIDNISSSVITLSLSSIDISSEAFSRLVSRCVNIVHLDLSSCNVSADRLLAVGTCLKQLKAVDLSYSGYVDDEVILCLADVCGDRLTELLLCQSYQLTARAINVVLQKCPHLTSFSVHCEAENDESIDLSLLSNMTTLALVYDGEGGTAFVTQLAQHCAVLQHLHLHIFDEEFSLQCMDVLVQKCVQLRTLSLEIEDGAPYEAEDEERWRTQRPHLEVKDKFVAELTRLRDL